MSNMKDFVIDYGHLRRYIGDAKNVTIPEDVTTIDISAFYVNYQPNQKIETVTITKNVTSVCDRAFFECRKLEKVEFLADSGENLMVSASAFDECPKLKTIVFPKGFLATENRRSAKYIPFINALSVREYACIWLFQDDKWLAWANNMHIDANEVAKELATIIENINISPKRLARLVDFVTILRDDLSIDSVKLLCDAVVNNDKKIGDKLINTDMVKQVLGGKSTDDTIEPIEEYVETLLEVQPLHPKANVFLKGIPFKDKDKHCSPKLLSALISPYLYLFDEHHEEYGNMYGTTTVSLKLSKGVSIPTEPDIIAKELDREALSDILETLVYSTTKAYRPYMYAYARFATEDSVIKLLKHAVSGTKAKVNNWKINLGVALNFSDTNAAYNYFEKNDNLEMYASMRGMTEQEIIDKWSLPKWNIDNGKIKSTCGNFLYEITSGFGLSIWDIEKEKYIRSIPSKTYPETLAEYKVIKKEVSVFYKQRTERIRKIYIRNEKIDASRWIESYCNNPVLTLIAEKVIWQDSNHVTFMVESGYAKTIDGIEYTPSGKVCVAHVLDMKKTETESWQNHLVKTGKILLVEQVWEPVAKLNVDSIGQFDNLVVSKEARNEFKRRLNHKGIEVKSQADWSEYNHRSNSYVFSDTGTMEVGNYLKIKYSVDEMDAGYTLLSFECLSKVMNRELNTVLFELSRMCVKSLVCNDNSKALSDVLDNNFTLAQITEFIKIASENNAANVQALLLEYKNKNFSDFDPMEEFTLD